VALLLVVVDELQERIGLERGTTDERAVDVGQCHQVLDVVRLDAAAVRTRRTSADFGPVHGADALADEGVDFLRLLGRGDFASADGPDGLVGDDDLGRFVRGDRLEDRVDLGGRPRP